MNETPKPANLDELLALAKGTKWESVARDEKALERLLVEEMKKSTDPMTKEIGSGLADGTMSWRTVATSSAYSDYIDRGVEGMREFDFAGTFGGAAEEEKPEPRKPSREDDEDEPFERDILRKRK